MAHSDVGPTLPQRGHFSPVSVARCDTLKRREAEAREHDARKYAEEVRRREREEREALERFEVNCRALGARDELPRHGVAPKKRHVPRGVQGDWRRRNVAEQIAHRDSPALTRWSSNPNLGERGFGRGPFARRFIAHTGVARPSRGHRSTNAKAQGFQPTSVMALA
jgi:hypothetical protein